ncbi:hypothetical protein FACS1894217_06940 [Clostridia bacterium]|nr:hypothetical protein FACS1894217_06940 [Clostridia bacterium]
MWKIFGSKKNTEYTGMVVPDDGLTLRSDAGAKLRPTQNGVIFDKYTLSYAINLNPNSAYQVTRDEMGAGNDVFVVSFFSTDIAANFSAPIIKSISFEGKKTAVIKTDQITNCALIYLGQQTQYEDVNVNILPIPYASAKQETAFKPKKPAPPRDDSKALRQEVDEAIKVVRNADLLRSPNNVVLVGNGSQSFMSLIRQFPDDGEFNFVWFINLNPKRFELSGMVPVFLIPWSFQRGSRWENKVSREISERENARIASEEHLRCSFENLKSRGSVTDENFAKLLTLETERFFFEIFEILTPKLVVIWNQFVNYNIISVAVAKRYGIPILFAENGNLPGTYNLDTVGEMGESLPARNPEWLSEKSVSKDELKRAGEILDYLKESGINRKKQPFADFNAIKRSLKRGRPTLFYAGQNDMDCGIWPYGDHAKQYHSPSFASSHEAMLFLAELAEKNDWNLIYKPHPIMCARSETDIAPPDNVIYVGAGNINDLVDFADVTITILSTTSYVALIREKPVVMLGFLPLRGQGCTYEAFEPDVIEETLQQAIEHGFTADQKQNFVRHSALMTKYYLFDEQRERDMKYGRSLADAIDFFRAAIAGMAEY